MPEPCRSCDQREIDFGGCRCQAALLTGNAANTDPACSLSPHHHQLVSIVERVQQQSEESVPAFNSTLSSVLFRSNPTTSN